MGVPPQAVKNKMAVEAPELNPDLIDDPVRATVNAAIIDYHQR